MASPQFVSFVTQLGLRKDVATALWEADVHSPQELAALPPAALQQISNTPLLVNNIHPILHKYVFNISMAKDPYKKALAMLEKHATMEDDCDAGSTASDAIMVPVNRPAGANRSSTRTSTERDRVTQAHTDPGEKPSSTGGSLDIVGGNFVQANILGTGPVTYNNTHTVITTTETSAIPDPKKRRANILNETLARNGTKVKVADFDWKDHRVYWIDDIKIPRTDFDIFERDMAADDIYGVRGSRRALILNNVTFTAQGMKTRTGSDVDCDHMEQLLNQLGFEVRRESNKTASEMKSLLQEFASHRANMNADMVAVYIGTHAAAPISVGSDTTTFNADDNAPATAEEFRNHTFVGTDGARVNFNDVKDMFSQRKLLLHKPKIFFLQFCGEENASTPASTITVGSDATPFDTDTSANPETMPRTEKIFSEDRQLDKPKIISTEFSRQGHAKIHDYPAAPISVRSDAVAFDTYKGDSATTRDHPAAPVGVVSDAVGFYPNDNPPAAAPTDQEVNVAPDPAPEHAIHSMNPVAENGIHPDDMVCVYATLAGSKAYRDTEDGSWFVTALIRTFTERAHKDDLLTILENVNKCVVINRDTDENSENEALQISELEHNLHKKIFFYPGLEI